MTQPIQALNILGTAAPAVQPAVQAAAPEDGTVHEVVIVGSGPAGYTAAIYTARAEMNPIVIAGALDAGGALMTTTDVENYPGFPEGVQGPELMASFQEQAERFGAEILTEDVTEVDLTGAEKLVKVGSEEYRARAVILATGSGYRHLGLPDEERLSGRGVSWCATCDGFFFRDKPIAVVGGGDSAMEEATFLSRFGSSVAIIHRRDELRASAIMAKRAENDPKITFEWNSAVESINGENQVESITLKDTNTGELRDLPISGLFIAIGHDPRSAFLNGQVELNPEGYVVVNQPGTATNIPGVFACGDLVDDHYQQAITAAGSGCRAAIDAEHYLADQA